jgi:hypothetical protein
MATVQDQRDSYRRTPAGALALPASRFSGPTRPLYCALTHMSQYVGGDAQHALIWLAVHAAWPSGLVEVGTRRLVAVSGMPDHAMRAALAALDELGWAPVTGRGAHGVYRRRLLLCDGCQRGNSSHAGVWFSVAMSYTLEPARWDGQRGNRRHETESRAVQVEPADAPVRSTGRPAALSPNGDGRAAPTPPGSAAATTTGPQGGEGRSAPSRSLGSSATAADATFKPSKQAREAPASNLIPFQARSSDGGTRRGATRTQSREPPGDTTGDPVLHPDDGRLIESEPERDPARWAR